MNRLKELRKKARISQAELAEKSGVNLRALQSYEQGRSDIAKASLQTAVALADVLGVYAEALIRDSVEPKFDTEFGQEMEASGLKGWIDDRIKEETEKQLKDVKDLYLQLLRDNLERKNTQ